MKHNRQNSIPQASCRILLSPYCSNKCLFCDRQGRAPKDQLKTIENNIYAAIVEFKSRGYQYLEICGEDPLEYDGLLKYVASLRRAGFQWITLSTNGIKLADKSIAKSLVEHIDLFRIPLYGSQASIHERTTRTRSSFNKTIQAIQNLKSFNKPMIEISSLLLKQNCLDLCNIFDLMHSLRCDNLYFAAALPLHSNNDKYYIPHKYQGNFLNKLIQHSLSQKKPVRLSNFPYCVVENNRQVIDQQPAIPIFHGLRGFKEKPFTLNSQRKKIDMCSRCSLKKECCGFILTDFLQYGTGDLKPVIK